MNSVAAVRRWTEAWLKGMLRGEPERIAAVYAREASFRSHPFRDYEAPAAYARAVLAAGPVDEASFEEPIVDGERAAVAYRVVAGGEEIRGVTLLRFNADGCVDDHRDFWAARSVDGSMAAPASG